VTLRHKGHKEHEDHYEFVTFVIFVAFVLKREAVGRTAAEVAYFLLRTSTPDTGPRQVLPE
jgi:hypothetical protein